MRQLVQLFVTSMVVACDHQERCLEIQEIDWFDGVATIIVTDYRERGDLPSLVSHLVTPPIRGTRSRYTTLEPQRIAPGGYRYQWHLGFDPHEGEQLRFDLLIREGHMTVLAIPVLVNDHLHVIADLSDREWCGW